jgi:hypothetical protein|tara:strand:+ start:1071 stop:1547 length:477 start_codon:yes stop_codon:yes gene_type:complete
MMEKKRFLDFLDRLDGGGAGQMGDKFEGGGLLSLLGNVFGSPYGSEDPERMAARQAFYNSDNIGGAPMTSAPPVGTVGGGAPTRVAPPTDEQRFGMNPPAVVAQYSGQGNFGSNMNPANAYGPAAMTFQDFVAGLGPVAQSASPDQLMTAYRQHMMGY